MAATSVPARMRASLRGYWRQARPWQRLGYLVGAALILASIFRESRGEESGRQIRVSLEG
jgi:hypothetical protein